MENVYYFIYCRGILGVKTNDRNFKWVYGSLAPEASLIEYEKCVVKFDVCIKPEKQLNNCSSFDQSFQSFRWNNFARRISYRRTLFWGFDIGYDIKLESNTVIAEIGEHYYKYIKNRTMNLHGMYYLLSDLVNIILLKNGYLTLYASAVYYKAKDKCLVNFAPPNTGKTFVATKLCELSDYKLVGEDVIISDGNKVYACPWTSTYRSTKSRRTDSAGAMNRVNYNISNFDTQEECVLTDLFVLSLGKEKLDSKKIQIQNQISILNGYLFNYYSSPIVSVLGFFDKEYYKSWRKLSDMMIEKMINKSRCYMIQCDESKFFIDAIQKIISGEIT